MFRGQECGGFRIMLHYTPFKIMPQNDNSESNFAFIYIGILGSYYFCDNLEWIIPAEVEVDLFITLIKYEIQDFFTSLHKTS